MRGLVLAATMTAGAAAAAAFPAAATTPVSGALHSYAEAEISDPADPSGAATSFSIQSQSWSGVPTNLLLFVGVQAGLGDSHIEAVAGSPFLRADWVSANQGDYIADHVGWTIQSDPALLWGAALTNHGAPDWSYTFTADGAGTIDLFYDTQAEAGSPDTSGFLGGWDIGWSGAGGGGHVGLGTVGDFVRQVGTGQTYTISLSNLASMHYGGGAEHDFAFMDGSFVWQIRTTPPPPPGGAPEPAAWALMLVGFAGLGAALRRRAATCAAGC